jgi:hypothetical protein
MVIVNGVLWSIELMQPNDWMSTKKNYGVKFWSIWNHGRLGSAQSRIQKWLYATDTEFDTIVWACPD